MKTGILLTTPGKNRFWHPCEDPERGLQEMAEGHAAANTYGAAWDHPATVIEFGTDDGKQFTASRLLRGPEPVKVETPAAEAEPVKEPEA